MDKKSQALADDWWKKHRFDVGKHAQLTAAFEGAERALEAAALDDIDAMLDAHTQASTLLIAYDARVRNLRMEFDQLEQEHPIVDPCVCSENASGVKQDGHGENDIEYWEVMVNCAREQIEAHEPSSSGLSM